VRRVSGRGELMNGSEFDRYLSKSVDIMVKDILKASLRNPRESFFMAGFALAAVKADKLREKAARQGDHIPPFLIASIACACNLHCRGCYARVNNACFDRETEEELSCAQWEDIFRQAAALGVSFVLLAGGEPLTRRDVLEAAGRLPGVLFPVFTNGTLITDEYIQLFGAFRNLIPVLSLEGGQASTDLRRGAGVFSRLETVMDTLKKNKILYGASVTVTSGNIGEVASDDFIGMLSGRDCKAVIFVEYVPADPGEDALAPGEEDRAALALRVDRLRRERPDMLFISFPGDEKESGGCLASGRGFFHINPRGGAEPCPFSPYSDTSLKQVSLAEALRSPLFKKLRESGLLTDEHNGGCVLFDKRNKVAGMLKN
jgi:MoaA/NifB/PqqE/SkfB family radical SAM enzyme